VRDETRLISTLSEAFGGLTARVAVRHQSLKYHCTPVVLANGTLSFGTGLKLSLDEVHSVEADLLTFELKLATAQGVVRVRALSADTMQMWMCVLPPSAYRNAEEQFAIAPLEDNARAAPLPRRRAASLALPPSADLHHLSPVCPPARPHPPRRPARPPAMPSPARPGLPPAGPPPRRFTVAVLSLEVAAGGRVAAELRARDLSGAINLDTGAALQAAELERAYAQAPRDPWTFCRRGASEQQLRATEAQSIGTVRSLDTGETLSARELERLYSAAPRGSAFEWAARSRASQGSDAPPRRGNDGGGAAARRTSVYQSGSACRVLPT